MPSQELNKKSNSRSLRRTSLRQKDAPLPLPKITLPSTRPREERKAEIIFKYTLAMIAHGTHSHTFLFCVPVRLGVAVLSLVGFISSGLVAAAFYVAFITTQTSAL